MTKLPLNPEKKIGKPQVLARHLILDGMLILVRLQKPFDEPPEEDIKTEKGFVRYSTCLIVETWSDATKSVITTGVKRPIDQTEEAFQFGVRYMLNNSTDEEIVHVLKIKGIHTFLKYQCGIDDSHIQLPKPPEAPRLEKKKPT